MSILAVVIGLVGSYLWFSKMYMNDERRFWIAVNNSMATTSVTRTLTNGGSGNKVIQDQQFFFAPQMVSRSHVSFTQKNATIDTAVETEGIAFPDAQYSRYTVFKTNQAREDGSLPNLDKILGKWEGNQATDADKEQAKLEYVGELVTLAVFGNYGSAFRHDLLNDLKNNNVYKIDVQGITSDQKDGKKVIIVPVTVYLKAYATALQKAFVQAGYGEFPALDPVNYEADATIPAQFIIQPKNNSIVGIVFGSREETYSGYGITKQVTAPRTDFSSGQLEQIVQEEIGSAF